MKKLHDYGLGKLNRVDIEQLNVELEAIHFRCSDMYFEDTGDDEQAAELLDSVGHSINKAVEALDGVLKLIRMRNAAHTADRFYYKRLQKRRRARARRYRAALADGGTDKTLQRVAAARSSH